MDSIYLWVVLLSIASIFVYLILAVMKCYKALIRCRIAIMLNCNVKNLHDPGLSMYSKINL